MKVKRYVGETAQEAMQKVRSDLGRDAIILNTRKIRRKGIAGIFSKPLIEVVATIDSDISSKPAKPVPAAPVKSAPQKREEDYDAPSFINELNANLKHAGKGNIQPAYASNAASFDMAVDEQIEIPIEKPVLPQPKAAAAAVSTPVSAPVFAELAEKELSESFTPNQMSEIKEMLNKVYDAVKLDYESSKLSDISRAVLEQLEKNEVEKVIINDLKEDIIECLDMEQQQQENLVRKTVYDILDKYIKDPEPFAVNKNKKVIVFIGPTGVGKTTTLAKLAANMVLNEKKKVGLITSDTYRIAAVEQLKTYGEIIGVPLSIIYSPAELTNAVNNFSDKDIILVDTAGRSHKDQYQLMELKSLLKSNIDFETYLVMSATTKFSDCVEIVKSYSFLDDYKLLFTKIDETSRIGLLLNMAYITKKPISYITTGQSVPDDIEIANKEKIINSLMGDNQR